jgi:DNA-binding beta-propeller fold protein YncE
LKFLNLTANFLRLSVFVACLAGVLSLVAAESLYVGDIVDDSVKRFDALTGDFLRNFVAPGSNDLHGPRGMIFDANHDLLVVDQNAGLPTNGEVLRFRGLDGAFLGDLVAEPMAPYAPRGMVMSPDGQVLYVADMGDFPDVGPELSGWDIALRRGRDVEDRAR